MEDRFLQQMKKGALELLVLALICRQPAYGYELLNLLAKQSGGLFALKEGTLYPILYRLEDAGLIEAKWKQGEGRTAPKKVYTATGAGEAELKQRRILWKEFQTTVDGILEQRGFEDEQ